MGYYGSRKLEDDLTFVCDTSSVSTAAELDPDVAPTYRVYKGLGGTPLLTGTMAPLDDVNTVGFNAATITLAAASGFVKGPTYHIHIRAIVAGVPCNISHNFQIEADVAVNSIAAAALTSIWSALTAAMVTAGSIGKLIIDALDATISSRLAGASYSAPPTAVAIAAAHLDLPDAVETGLTVRGAHRLHAAAAAGVVAGAATPVVTIKNAVAGSKVRITAATDADGNRTAVTTDVT